MKEEHMKLCDLFGENPNDIELVKNENDEVLKANGKQFVYHNRELILKSKNQLLIEELKCAELLKNSGAEV